MRNVGNNGAHIEEDIVLIVEVEDEEAGMPIGQVEILVEEWYGDRRDKEHRLGATVDIAAQKENQRKAD